jgi:hypothetical protein
MAEITRRNRKTNRKLLRDKRGLFGIDFSHLSAKLSAVGAAVVTLLGIKAHHDATLTALKTGTDTSDTTMQHVASPSGVQGGVTQTQPGAYK